MMASFSLYVMAQTLTIFTLAYNLNKIKYPWKAAIQSALHFANEVIVAECFSTDGTYEDLLEIKDPRLKILRHPWGTTCWIQKTLAELCSRAATSDWIFYLNADEVIHEASTWHLDDMRRRKVPLGRAHYTHFLGNFETTWPFIYDRVIRLGQGNKWLWSNDACELECDHSKAEDMNVFIHHYGKVSVGREVEAGIKEQEFQQLYTEYGFPDQPLMELIKKHGRLDYADMMRDRWKQNNMPDESKAFTGTHPIFVQEWIKEMKNAQIPGSC